MAAQLYVLSPPYGELGESIAVGDLPKPPRGSIVYLDQADCGLDDLVLEAKSTAQKAPAAMLIIGVDRSLPLPLNALESLRSAGRCALVPSGRRTAAEILAVARETGPALDKQVVIRLRLFGATLSSQLRNALLDLLRGRATWKVEDWARALDLSERTLKRRLSHDWAAPGPPEWVRLVCSLRAVVALETHESRSVEEVLAEAGFGSPKRGRASLQRVTGLSPAEIRQLVGWYWALEHWLQTVWPAALAQSEQDDTA